MREEVLPWWRKAKDDLEKALILFRNQKYDGAIFFCQQAVEKGLKTVWFLEKNKIKKIHDLVELGKEVQLPDHLLNYCKELTQAYIYARYPDIHKEKNLDVISKKFLNYTEEILQWIEKKI